MMLPNVLTSTAVVENRPKLLQSQILYHILAVEDRRDMVAFIRNQVSWE